MIKGRNGRKYLAAGMIILLLAGQGTAQCGPVYAGAGTGEETQIKTPEESRQAAEEMSAEAEAGQPEATVPKPQEGEEEKKEPGPEEELEEEPEKPDPEEGEEEPEKPVPEEDGDPETEPEAVFPEWTLESAVSDAGTTVIDEEQNYCFRESLTVCFRVQEEGPGGETGPGAPDLSGGETDPEAPDFSEDGTEPELSGQPVLKRDGAVLFCEDGYYKDILYESGSYVYTMEAPDGSVDGETVTIAAKKVCAPPRLAVRYLSEPAAVGETLYFREDPQAVLCADAPAGIRKMEYEGEEGIFRTLEDFETESFCVYGENASAEAVLGETEAFRELLTDMRDGSYRWNFRVTDVLGGTAEEELEFAVDRTAPDTEVFVSYHSDGSGADGLTDTRIVELAGRFLDRLFGKSRIDFELYVRDQAGASGEGYEPSGIDQEDLLKQIKTADGQATIRNLRVVSQKLASFSHEGVWREGYVQIAGSMVLPADESPDSRERLCIGRLKDLAGNTTEETAAEDFTGTMILYFDRTCPKLCADYGSAAVDEERRSVFYREAGTVRLILTEENYDAYVDENGEPVSPVLRVEGTADTEVVPGEWQADGPVRCTEFSLPAGEEAETEYRFTVEYRDGSGNPLTGDDSCGLEAADGRCTGYVLVVDTRAPRLTAFSVDGTPAGELEGAPLFRNREGADVTVSFSINDHAQYWDPARVQLAFFDRKTGKETERVSGSEMHWENSGRSHRASCAFDGEAGGGTHCYEARLSYEDCAGNRLAGGGSLEEELPQGVCQSREFWLDHEAPEVTVSYGEAARLVRDGQPLPSLDRTAQAPATGYTAYYREEIKVRLSVRDAGTEPVHGGAEPKGFYMEAVEEDRGRFRPAVEWSRKGTLYEGSFTLSEEGQYRICVSCEDPAGNVMKAEQAEGSRWETAVNGEGKYESVLLVLDRTAPQIRISYTDTLKQEKTDGSVYGEDGSRYECEPVYLKLEVEEQNFRLHELKRALTETRITDLTGKPAADGGWQRYLEQMDDAKTGSGTFVFYLPLLEEAVYEIAVGCGDLAGNRTSAGMERIAVDGTAPELKLSCTVEKSGFMDAVRYRDLKYLFADSRVTVTAEASDTVSGIRTVRWTLREADGSTAEKTESYEPAAGRSCTFSVPSDGADYKGTVSVEVCDWSGNHTVREWEQITESAGKHAEVCRALIETDTEPGRTVGDVDYYNTDVRFRLLIEEPYCGLRRVSCRGGSTIDFVKDYAEHAGGREGPQYEFAEELVLEAAGNNVNEVPVTVEYLDNAGHSGRLERFYHIDATPPVVEVAYDENRPSAGGLYNQSRMAAVTIRERNLNPEDVEFRITSTEGCMPLIGEWETSGTGDDTIHTCRVLFEEDSDYTFAVSCMDLAGNRAEYGREDAFTIDRTAPVLTVNYDHRQSGLQDYYAQSRRAVIDILEHHFDASLVNVAVGTESGMQDALLSGWSRNGDHHTAEVFFALEGAYTLEITGTDLAENGMEAYGTERFVIDQTAPELVISGVGHRSANSGALTPEIRCSDANYQPDSLTVFLEGHHHGVMAPAGTRIRTEDGEIFRMEDFAYEPEEDDLYRLTVLARDLAGNESREEVMFSVNRFGSVYTLEDRTELLAGRKGSYYTRTGPDMVVTETNVDTLEFREVTCSLNGKLKVLKEGTDYTVETSGTEESWKQYVYRIPGRNFEREGAYALTIYSEDRAENVSDNHTKGKRLEFVVDRTGPSILLSGLEDGGRYRERSREVTLDVQDNVKTAEVKVSVNGVVSTYSASELEKQEGRITLMVGGGNQWQSIGVTARDAAGNRQELKKRNFLITPNVLIQFFMNKKLFYGFMGGLALAWACVWRLVFRRRRPRVK